MSKKSAKKLIPLLMFVFTLAGVVGFIYEEICGFINEGEFFKRGTTYGPWIPIYGVGAMLIYFACIRIRKKPWLVFLISCLLCGTLELACGYVFDKYFHMRLWDYSEVILNWGHVNGYICIRSVITWGLFGMLLMLGFLPLLEKFQSKRPRAFNVVAISLFVLFAIDIVLSQTLK